MRRPRTEGPRDSKTPPLLSSPDTLFSGAPAAYPQSPLPTVPRPWHPERPWSWKSRLWRSSPPTRPGRCSPFVSQTFASPQVQHVSASGRGGPEQGDGPRPPRQDLWPPAQSMGAGGLGEECALRLPPKAATSGGRAPASCASSRSAGRGGKGPRVGWPGCSSCSFPCLPGVPVLGGARSAFPPGAPRLLRGPLSPPRAPAPGGKTLSLHLPDPPCWASFEHPLGFIGCGFLGIQEMALGLHSGP